jgi:hypothetical protein
MNSQYSVLKSLPLKSMILSCFLLFGLNGFSQINFSLGSGAAVGWWVQQNINSQNGEEVADRSHFSLGIPFTSSVSYRTKKVNIGLTGSILFVNDDRIVHSEDKWFTDRTTPISNGWFSVSSLGIKANYYSYSSPKFSVAPEIQAGIFQTQTTHPNQSNFKNRYYFSLGVEVEWKKNNQGLFFTPRYREYRMTDETPGYADSNIYFIGIDFGYKFYFQ